MQIMQHNLKTWPDYYRDIESGIKTFDVRKDDRGFRVGDTAIFHYWNPAVPTKEKYSGEELRRRIIYILRGGQFGIEEGYCVLGLDDTILPF